MTKDEDINIGGVAGGATSAARLRRLDEKKNSIILFEKERTFLMQPGLLIILGRIEERENFLCNLPKNSGRDMVLT